jgi:hypothetical protein
LGFEGVGEELEKWEWDVVSVPGSEGPTLEDDGYFDGGNDDGGQLLVVVSLGYM